MRHGPDDGLPALVDRDVFHHNLLLASGPVSFECLDSRRKGVGELVEGPLCTVLLWNGLHMHEPACEGQQQRPMDGENEGRGAR
jgi:hypothetical protein